MLHGTCLSLSVDLLLYRPLSRRLDRCDRVIHNESGDPNGGNMCSFSGATCTSRDVTMQITFLTRKSALIYRRDLRQRVASLSIAMAFWRYEPIGNCPNSNIIGLRVLMLHCVFVDLEK